MNNKSCIDRHQYGLWNIDNEKNIAYRICDKCKFRRELPITEEITHEINKQIEASKIFKAFMLVNDNDENIINYLELILEDYVNYLSKTDYKALSKRIKKLEELDILDARNILYLSQLDTYFVLETTEDTMQLDELNIKFDTYEQEEQI